MRSYIIREGNDWRGERVPVSTLALKGGGLSDLLPAVGLGG